MIFDVVGFEIPIRFADCNAGCLHRRYEYSSLPRRKTTCNFCLTLKVGETVQDIFEADLWSLSCVVVHARRVCPSIAGYLCQGRLCLLITPKR
jgi:hypothetical protein